MYLFWGNSSDDVNRAFHHYCTVFINQVMHFNFIFR